MGLNIYNSPIGGLKVSSKFSTHSTTTFVSSMAALRLRTAEGESFPPMRLEPLVLGGGPLSKSRDIVREGLSVDIPCAECGRPGISVVSKIIKLQAELIYNVELTQVWR
jgi:hypothetical protein